MKYCLHIIGIAGLLILPAFMLQAQVPVYLDESAAMEKRVEDAMVRMTREEKVALCHAQSKFSSPGVPRLGIPEIWMSDGPHGIRAEISWDSWAYAQWTNDSCTAFPALTCLAASFDPSLAYLYGKVIGEEARYRKKDVLLGPGVNIYRTPLNGRNFEYLGEDPYLASQMAVPYIQGVQENGVAACVKHFALNNQEKWRGSVDVEVSPRVLHEIYLPAFRAAVREGGVWAVMGAYNRYRGQHCCHNEFLLNGILKNDWQFDGVVVSDWGGTHNTQQAAEYGLDIEMGTYTNGLTFSKTLAYDEYCLARPFREALERGEISEEVLDDKAKRILRLIFRTSMNSRRPWGSFASPEHAAIARQIAAEGIVLLKNKRSLLPLQPGKYKRIAVIGENATRSMTRAGGSSELKVKKEVVPLEGIRERFGRETEIVYTLGYASGKASYGRENRSLLSADSLRQKAVEMAKEADLVVFVGGLNKNHFQDCEGGDRLQYGLPFGQDSLIRALAEVNPQIVVVLLSGNAVEMPWLGKVPAVVQAWYGGSEGGHALADILSGDVTPSGKLPFSFPVKLADCGAHAFGELCYPGDSIREVYQDGLLVGYRWYDTRRIEPLFPFGYGLSYTTFTVGKPRLEQTVFHPAEEICLKTEVTNTGLQAGSEVVQVYVSDPECSVMRPLKELKGFAKVSLQPGETRTAEVRIPVSSLSFYDEEGANWKLEPGNFVLHVGTSSRHILHRVKIKVKGGKEKEFNK